jgi:hypothetical protein
MQIKKLFLLNRKLIILITRSISDILLNVVNTYISSHTDTIITTSMNIIIKVINIIITVLNKM